MAVISNHQLLSLIARVVDVPGDFVEVGVFRGATFTRLSLLAHSVGKVAHGFDSFEGMAPPTKLDYGQYPEGKLSVGGVAAFEKVMKAGQVPKDSYELWPGFVPHCFEGYDAPVAFALVDVDQYVPTKISLDWVWPRISVGGIMVLDDYFRNREGLAARAIDEWIQQQDPVEARVLDYVDTQLYVQKAYITPKKLPERIRARGDG